MEPLSFASFSLAAVLASLPVNGNVVSKPTITTQISPAIAGQWEIDLNSVNSISERAPQSATTTIAGEEREVIGGQKDGVFEQSERRVISIVPSDNIKTNINKKISASTTKPNQCRELYNFGANNEMWAVSGKEWTYGRYLVTHREEGLPIIAIKTIYDNNEVDCSGNQVDQSNEALIAFLKHDGNQMQWCADPEGKECFMDFHRVLP